MRVLSLAALTLLAGSTVAHFIRKEAMKRRDDFIMKSKADPSTPHEMIFAVKQKNLDILEKEVLERATPGNPKYQKWMTFWEVGELVGNPEAAKATEDWLNEHGIKVSKIL